MKETRKERETASLLACSRAVLEYGDFPTTARAIFDTAKELIGATAGYVALLSPDGSENELLFLDAGGRSCSVDTSLPMPIRGLRARSYRTGKVVYDNHFMNSPWFRFLPGGHVTLDNVMFAPLVLEGKTLGLVGLSNKPGGFTDQDAEMAGAFGEFAAIALRNSRLLDARDRAVEAAEASERHLSDILDSISDGFFALDEGLGVTYFNKAAGDLLCRSREDVLGKTLLDAFPEFEGSVFEKKFSRALAHREFAAFETYFDRPPYTNWYAVRIYPARKGIAVYFRITTEQKYAEEERKRLETELAHARKMEALGTLAGGVAHDFNNILGIILGNTELALLDMPEAHYAHRRLLESQKACLRARDLIGQIMTFSRHKENRRGLVDLARLVGEALSMIRATCPSTIEIVQNIGTLPRMVLANPGQIRQVLVNLCTNAVYAMRAHGGTLSVELESVRVDGSHPVEGRGLGPGDYGRLTVSDTGCGIPNDIMERIFDPYFTTKPPGEGSGIGLAVVRGIVEKHGGTVTFQSRPGKGTTFQVHLPLANTVPARETEEESPLPKGNERILYVDDEPDLVITATHMFKYLGYRLTAKNSGPEALKVFRADPYAFDLIITDQTMPGMTGETLAGEILRIRSDVPIIVTTGYDEQIDENKARKAGIAGYLMKPVALREMAVYVRRILGD